MISYAFVDALFWTRGVFDDERNPLPYPLDVIEGVSVSIPYMLDSRVSISLKKLKKLKKYEPYEPTQL